MKKIINEEGFKKAMKEGKTWTCLDCQLSENEDGECYWEIDKTVFENKDGTTEQLAFGHDDDSLETVTKIWNNLIKKYNPDEYFVNNDLRR
jgi:hypothetical protein